jgi:hypothetical protein
MAHVYGFCSSSHPKDWIASPPKRMSNLLTDSHVHGKANTWLHSNLLYCLLLPSKNLVNDCMESKHAPRHYTALYSIVPVATSEHCEANTIPYSSRFCGCFQRANSDFLSSKVVPQAVAQPPFFFGQAFDVDRTSHCCTQGMESYVERLSVQNLEIRGWDVSSPA